jgi:2-polyprenyl-3-methyl-5-hydroxy-6-metoxy-1,4-benzoquinol methylase
MLRMTTWRVMANRTKRSLKKFRRRPVTVTGRSTATRDEWEREAQEGEFRWHKRDRWRQTPDFMAQTDRVFRHFGFTPGDYAGQTVIDVGAGSMLRTKFFAEARLIALEPLADRFIAEIPSCDLQDAAEVHSRPAEQLIESLVGSADLVISINVLDHCFDFAEIVKNIRQYLKPDGIAFLSFDMHAAADEMHPLSLTEETCAPLFADAGLSVEKVTTGMGDSLGGPQTYGHGPFTLNYWLRPV